MNFKHTKVGTRLALGYVVVFALLLAIVATALLEMRQMQARINNITDFNNVQIAEIVTMQDSVTDRMIALRNLALLKTEQQMRPEVARIREKEKVYADELAKLAKTFEVPDTSAEEKALYASLLQQEQAARPLMADAEKFGLANDDDAATDTLMTKLRPVQIAWIAALDQLVALETKLNNEEASEAKAEYHTAMSLMAMLSVAALVVGIAAATLITRALLRQLGGEPDTAANIATRIAGGDLTVDVPVKAGDSGSMMLAMREMRDRLAAIVAEVRTGTDAIATSAGEVSAGNMDLSSRTEQQASSLEETASSMEELTSTVKQNADNARQASVMATTASGVATRGGQVVAQVVDTMDAINTSAKKIVDIISVIDGIAFQTNILALNAAVEAARAGEQGRGFAVVAGEVRSLAHRSAAAAKEIKVLIDDSVEKVDTGSQLVSQAGATMGEIVDSVQRVTDIMSEISAASHEQSSGIDQVNQAIAQMDEVTQQNAALVEEASAASEAMQEQAGKLAQLVGTFTLNQIAQPAIAAQRAPAPAPIVRTALAVAPKPAAQAAKAVHKAASKAAVKPRKAPAASESEWEEF